jgi:hypothetical protein
LSIKPSDELGEINTNFDNDKKLLEMDNILVISMFPLQSPQQLKIDERFSSEIVTMFEQKLGPFVYGPLLLETKEVT